MFNKSNVGTRHAFNFLSWLIPLMLSTLLCGADELSEKGREIFKNNRHSVVTVQIVVKSKFSVAAWADNPMKPVRTFTAPLSMLLVSTVLSLAATDPSAVIAELYGRRGFQI
jgi:hypothetical protein